MNKTIKVILLIAAIAASVWFFALRDASTQADASAYSIETVKVERGDVARLVSASGTVRALTTVEVGSQVSGQITELNADFNSVVSKNQIIARLDPQSFESRVTSAEADVRSARANIDVQKAQIERAEANLALYRKEYARQQELYAQKLIPSSALEDAERQLTVGQSDLNVSKAQLRTVQASLAQRLASLESAKVDLERTIIRSPIDGVVIERNVDVGQTVAASLSAPVLFRIAKDLQEIRIDADVVEADIGGIDEGDTVTFDVDAYPDDKFSGVVEQVRLAAKELQNVVTYTVVIAAENRRSRLLPGMTANVEITAEKRQDVLRIADTAVRFKPTSNGPQVIDGNTEDRGGPGAGRQGPNAGRNFSQMFEGMNLDPERQAAIEHELSDDMREFWSSMSGNAMATFDRNRMRQMMRARTNKILKKSLSPEEFKLFEKLQNARSSVRRIEVYSENPDGTLSKRSIAIGLSDGSYVEIRRGAEEGDVFVSRVIKAVTGE
ncbi:MAG: HlyD family efflux transporter periplasmic adaptor subunit [Gammaproteobacteria bacterium]|nr:HlyD family efflux transporter periplasmic adaptor subunit [Gammaproteobacteria bacterium]NNM14496.1 HlyD family efflux transporter periplasmic adaptor subunit [Gammaproteobacteria bacterium]